jgi:hypothetical protein
MDDGVDDDGAARQDPLDAPAMISGIGGSFVVMTGGVDGEDNDAIAAGGCLNSACAHPLAR